MQTKKISSRAPDKKISAPSKSVSLVEPSDRKRKSKPRVFRLYGRHSSGKLKHPLVSLLRNQVDVKGMSPARVLFGGVSDRSKGELLMDEQTLSVARSLTSVQGIYEFKLTRGLGLSTSVGGIVNFYANNDPSIYAEWSSLTALFSQVKLRRVEVSFSREIATAIPTTTSVGSWQPAAFNINYDDIGAPGGYASVLDSPKFMVWNYAFDTSATPKILTLDFTGEHEPLWTDVTAPASSTLYQGCPGCTQIYIDNATPSTEIIWFTQTLYIQMMNRY